MPPLHLLLLMSLRAHRAQHTATLYALAYRRNSAHHNIIVFLISTFHGSPEHTFVPLTFSASCLQSARFCPISAETIQIFSRILPISFCFPTFSPVRWWISGPTSSPTSMRGGCFVLPGATSNSCHYGYQSLLLARSLCFVWFLICSLLF
jgi:hypothetical protein